MPPKAKFSQEQIIETAFEIVRTYGIAALTARSLAEKLNSSPRPIFTVFNSMEEVQNKVINKAKTLYKSYVDAGLSEEKAFRGVGKAYIRFAVEEEKLFKLLFMQELTGKPEKDSILYLIDKNYEDILHSIEREYGFEQNTAKSFYLHLWIYSHGIASLSATKVCKFSENEIANMLDEVGASLVRKYKAEGK